VDEPSFWKLIDLVDRDVLVEDEDEAVEPLINALAAREVSDIADFAEILARLLYALDGRRYANEAGKANEHPEAFLYARCFVVAQGEAHYRQVLADPTRMPRSEDEHCEPLLDVASLAHEGVTGEPRDFETSVSPETGSNRARWD
jgi:hypothetical protein